MAFGREDFAPAAPSENPRTLNMILAALERQFGSRAAPSDFGPQGLGMDFGTPAPQETATATAAVPPQPSRLASILSAIQGRVGPALASAGRFAGDVVAGAPDATGTRQGGVLQGLLATLPDLADVRHIAAAAGAQRGFSPIEAAVSSSLIHGPLAAAKQHEAEAALQRAVAQKLFEDEIKQAQLKAANVAGGTAVAIPNRPGQAGAKEVITTRERPTLAQQLDATIQGRAVGTALESNAREKADDEQRRFEAEKAQNAIKQNRINTANSLLIQDFDKHRQRFYKALGDKNMVGAQDAAANALLAHAKATKFAADNGLPSQMPDFIAELPADQRNDIINRARLKAKALTK